MAISLAYLGPSGTNSEVVALACAERWEQETGESVVLQPYPDIARALRCTARGETDLAVVPVENSIGGSVTISMDVLWELDCLQIQQALILPIAHVLVSCNADLRQIERVYSHPQALAQCQRWLEQNLSEAQVLPMNSTTEALGLLARETTAAAIASPRAAQLYNLPVLATNLNDYPDNCTRFWLVGLQPSRGGANLSLAFGTAANVPGALVKPLQIFADRGINMSRIESRPTKRLLGEYIFFIDLEADATKPHVRAALAELAEFATPLKILGNYDVIAVPP